MIKVYNKAILPLGFKANAVSCGIKKSGKLDLALIYSVFPARAACKFTTNKLAAAPIRLNKKILKRQKYFQAIITNSGNANAFTGVKGFRDAENLALGAARALKINRESVLVNSTGVIGIRLPLDKIKHALAPLARGLSHSGMNKAALGILTTDTFAKEVTVKFGLGNATVTICGIAKGAGMIAPNMATMLCFIMTDAHIAQQALDKALDLAVADSFNCITVDGCMSTNDSVMLLANAKAGNPIIETNRNFGAFSKSLKILCLELAKLVVKDAEGSTKFIQINVKGAKNSQQAKIAALAIANSALFKAAAYGENPNFGRIVAAIGASGINVKEEAIRMRVSPLNKKEIKVDVSLGGGKGSATVYTSDLTPEYIKINASYN